MRMMQRRFKPWVIGASVLLAPVLCLAIYIATIIGTGNFHPVVEGEIYRSAQPTPERIAAYKSHYGIATIINLRGKNDARSWYLDEIAASRRLGINHIDFRMSAKHILTQARAAELIDLMRTAPKPVLIHCHSGADRAGLAAALYLASIGRGEAAAESQLSWRFGHFGIPHISRTHAMDVTFENLEPWLGIPPS